MTNEQITMFLAVETPSHEDMDYAQELFSNFKHQEYIKKKLKPNMKLIFREHNQIGE